MADCPRPMGFWETWNPDEMLSFRSRDFHRDAVLIYMSAAQEGTMYLGWAQCRLCTEALGSAKALGTCDMVTPDGKWTFPEKWEHYIVVHGLKPTEPQFIEDALEWCRKLDKQDG